MRTRPGLALAAAAALTLTSLTAWLPAAAHAAAIPPPVHHGTLRVFGLSRDGAAVTATGLRWRVPRLPGGMSLLSFEVAYSWQSCDAAGTHCRAGADTVARSPSGTGSTAAAGTPCQPVACSTPVTSRPGRTG